MGRVFREALGAPTHSASVALLNEALGEVETELDVGREVPRSAGRITLAAGGFFALIALARGLPASGVDAVLPALVTFAGGGICAFVCATLARAASKPATLTRERWNALTRAIERLYQDSRRG
jgi:hypothetical protein